MNGQLPKIQPPPRRLPFAWILFLLALLVLPVLAALRLPHPYPWVAAGVVLLMSANAAVSIKRDKLKAQTGEWRTPESTLHMLELFGGWPGAFLAQRRYRHKTSKASYQFTFWLIVGLYQVAAGDFLSKWWLSQHLAAWITGQLR